MLFAHADWLAQRWLAKYYSPPSSRRKTKWLPVSNKVTLKQVKLLFGPLVIQLVWYILKQLFTSVLVKVVDIYLAASPLHHYSPPLWLIIVNSSPSTGWDASPSPVLNLLLPFLHLHSRHSLVVFKQFEHAKKAMKPRKQVPLVKSLSLWLLTGFCHWLLNPGSRVLTFFCRHFS